MRSYGNAAKTLLTLLLLFSLSFTSSTAFAQSILKQLRDTTVAGQGKVTIEQDARLDSIVNGQVIVPSVVETKVKVERPISQTMQKTTKSKVSEVLPIGQRLTGATYREKVKGYRIQVYFGGNQRTDQTNAQKMGNKVMARFPELKAYTSFESPHWRCRVGDFTSREDAGPYISRLRSAGFCPDATIVRSEIYIYE